MTERDQRATLDVAVGVLVRADGKVLLADRPQGKPYAGYWEFPGGKIEPGETVAAALKRELHEELGIDIGPALPWVVFEHDYPHAYVRLNFCRVFEWRGEPHARENQRLGFFDPAQPLPAPLLPAAVPALRWLALPPVYAVSMIDEMSETGFLAALDRTLANGLRLLVIREPRLGDDRIAAVASQVIEQAHAHGARVLLSSRHRATDTALFDGVHLTARDLMLTSRRPPANLVAASVHDRRELDRAGAIGCDFAVLGSVLPTPSHADGPTLGWRGVSDLLQAAPIPVYAIGGLGSNDLAQARACGAHGVAFQRAAWTANPRGDAALPAALRASRE